MILVSIITSSILGSVIGAVLSRKRTERQPTYEWTALKSGWFKDISLTHSAYAIKLTENEAYWWISKSGRTIIEGPAPTVQKAFAEIDKAADEFIRS